MVYIDCFSLTYSARWAANNLRKTPTQPERVLDAPGMVDDSHLNPLSWSCQNALAVAAAGHQGSSRARDDTSRAPGVYFFPFPFSLIMMFLNRLSILRQQKDQKKPKRRPILSFGHRYAHTSCHVTRPPHTITACNSSIGASRRQRWRGKEMDMGSRRVVESRAL